MSGYTPHTDADIAAMLATIGVPSIDALFAQIPAALRANAGIDLPAGLTEPELIAHVQALAARNSIRIGYPRPSTRYCCVRSS